MWTRAWTSTTPSSKVGSFEVQLSLARTSLRHLFASGTFGCLFDYNSKSPTGHTLQAGTQMRAATIFGPSLYCGTGNLWSPSNILEIQREQAVPTFSLRRIASLGIAISVSEVESFAGIAISASSVISISLSARADADGITWRPPIMLVVAIVLAAVAFGGLAIEAMATTMRSNVHPSDHRGDTPLYELSFSMRTMENCVL
jgi:hypothetical protein